jgi:hypothetical protein
LAVSVVVGYYYWARNENEPRLTPKQILFLKKRLRHVATLFPSCEQTNPDGHVRMNLLLY